MESPARASTHSLTANSFAPLSAFLSACALMLFPACAAVPPPAPVLSPPAPTLVVMIAIDQFSANLFEEYRPLYRHGLQRLSRGVVFPNGYQGHASTETCPGHSTILTGGRPARTGIIANDWQMPADGTLKDGVTRYGVYCVADPHDNDKVTSRYLRMQTLGDRMKARHTDAKVVSISGKDRAAVMLGGHNADLTLWWTREKGFQTYENSKSDVPQGITEVNSSTLRSIESFLPAAPADECKARAKGLDVGGGVTVGVPSQDKSYSAWRASPAFDAATLAAAKVALGEMQLGRGPRADLLALSFSATDYVGHKYGTGGIEMCTQLVRLDEIIGELLQELDRTHIPYVVALTADHGGLEVTERNVLRGAPEATRMAAELYPEAMSKQLESEFSLTGKAVLGRFFTPDIYFSPTIPPEKREQVVAAALKRYRSHTQVEHVYTREELIAAPAPQGPVDEWTLLERAKASFDEERSGSLLVLLKPLVTPLPPATAKDKDYVAGHGSPWSYDRRVPILFWWNGVSGFEQPKAVETVDVMPTLAQLIGLQIHDGEIDGHCLDISAEPEGCAK